MDRFWERMSTLFTPHRVSRWKRAVADAEGSSGILQNMLCLSDPARELWKEGAFALKPLDDPEPTSTSLSVEFHWIEWAPNEGADFPECPPLFNFRTGQYIRSGDIFTIHTDDPVSMPLPSVEIVNMQWVLTRIVGLARACLGESVDFLLDTIEYGRNANSDGGITERDQAVDAEETQDSDFGWGPGVSIVYVGGDGSFSAGPMFTADGLYDAGLNFDAFVNDSGIV